MADWTRAGDVDVDVKVEPMIGDLWNERGSTTEAGFAWVTDILPFTRVDEDPKPVTRLCVTRSDGRYEWFDIGDFRKRFIFRRRA